MRRFLDYCDRVDRVHKAVSGGQSGDISSAVDVVGAGHGHTSGRRKYRCEEDEVGEEEFDHMHGGHLYYDQSENDSEEEEVEDDKCDKAAADTDERGIEVEDLTVLYAERLSQKHEQQQQPIIIDDDIEQQEQEVGSGIGGLESTGEIISFIDPISLIRLETPVRGIHCTHASQCFDKKSFLFIMRPVAEKNLG